MKRKAHVGTAVVDGVHLVTVCEQAERVPVEVNYEASCSPQLCERRRTSETPGSNSSHLLLLLTRRTGKHDLPTGAGSGSTGPMATG
jgi:hypothetical protein